MMDQKTIEAISRGEVAVIATDTLYGLVGQALNRTAVERIYRIKGRSPQKPFIILISSLDDLRLFGVEPITALNSYWPGAVSIILPCKKTDLNYLHRGTATLAFRLPDKPELIELISTTGPLVAPSANPEGKEPATTIAEAKSYFKNEVNHYVDGGVIKGGPSRLIRITDSGFETLR